MMLSTPSASIILVVTLLVSQDAAAGFTSGAPCSARNTAYLNANARWRLPPVDSTQCVDISGMGSSRTLSVIPQVLNATTLYADHMNLERFPKFAVAYLKKLRLIDLSGNKIRKLFSRSLVKSHDIHTLLLADNRIYSPKTRPLLVSPVLKTLSLSNNRIRRVTKITFSELPSLTVLYLDRNLLKHLRAEVLKPMKYLKYLHVGGNLLTKVPPQTALPHSLKTFITKGNPLLVYPKNNTATRQ